MHSNHADASGLTRKVRNSVILDQTRCPDRSRSLSAAFSSQAKPAASSSTSESGDAGHDSLNTGQAINVSPSLQQKSAQDKACHATKQATSEEHNSGGGGGRRYNSKLVYLGNTSTSGEPYDERHSGMGADEEIVGNGVAQEEYNDESCSNSLDMLLSDDCVYSQGMKNYILTARIKIALGHYLSKK